MKHILLLVVLASCLHAQTTSPAKPGELFNGDFSQRVGTGPPTGWTYTKTPWIPISKKGDGKTPAKGDGKIPDGVTLATLQEGSKAIVRITYTNNQRGCLVQLLDVPPKAKEVRFKISVRGAPDVKGGKQSMPDAGFRFFNAGGDHLPERKTSPPPKQLSDKSWNEIEFICDVPPNAAFCHVILGNTGNTDGTFDFRGASVRFR